MWHLHTNTALLYTKQFEYFVLKYFSDVTFYLTQIQILLYQCNVLFSHVKHCFKHNDAQQTKKKL